MKKQSVKPNPPPKVVVSLKTDLKSGQAQLVGIFRFFGGEHLWNPVIITQSERSSLELLEKLREPDVAGAIISLPASPDVVKLVQKSSLSTVVLGLSGSEELKKRTENIVFVEIDHALLGGAAADFFLDQGRFRSFGFVGMRPEFTWSKQRGEAFARRLAKWGFDCHAFTPSSQATSLDGPAVLEVVEWIRTLKYPAGLLVANDFLARQILTACYQAEIEVPEDVAVLGVDNDEMLCSIAFPPLSSIEPDFEEAGYRAAELMDQMLKEKLSGTATALCGIKRIVSRSSTTSASPAGKLVQKATAFIQANACSGITAEDVATHLKVSRRLLDLRFRELQKTSVLSAIRENRINTAKKLLEDTDLPISSISEKCGYDNGNYMSALFKEETGLSMGDYRDLHRQGHP